MAAEPDGETSTPLGGLADFARTAGESVDGVIESQLLLSSRVERVSAELQTFMASCDLPPLDQYTQQLSHARRRLGATNAMLVQIQERLVRMERLAARTAHSRAVSAEGDAD